MWENEEEVTVASESEVESEGSLAENAVDEGDCLLLVDYGRLRGKRSEPELSGTRDPTKSTTSPDRFLFSHR